jgi:RNA polymerase sigma factor (sigma-70 family)
VVKTPDITGVRLRRRLVERDPLAKAELAEEFVPSLTAHLKKSHPEVQQSDPDLIWDAVTDAVFELANEPQKWNPKLSSLATYLKMSVEGNLLNALNKRTRRRAKEVELSDDDGNKEVGANPEELALDRLSINDAMKQQILVAFPNSADRQLLLLMYAKERRTDEYARVLGLTRLSAVDRFATVKKAKDRLKARIRRLGWSLP